ncbi:MAG: PIN domain-containing protein [Treponema sp.]|nr:PIN domain-containing protein [Treponema sp.]
MILVDTNILVDFFNKPTEEFAQIFAKEDVAVCGVVQAELLHGATSEKQISAIQDMFTGLKYIDIKVEDWIQIGLFLLRLRKCGLKVPFPDAVIAFLAIKENCEVWTRDKHFSLIKEKIPELKLFSF